MTTALTLSMYDLDTNTLQMRLQFNVIGLPITWNTPLAEPGEYPIVTDPYDIDCIQSLRFTATAPHIQSGYVKSTQYSANSSSVKFYVYPYDEDPRANASKCLKIDIKALCNTFNDYYGAPDCEYTNFLFMNSSKMYGEQYYGFSNDGVFKTDTAGEHDNVYYAYNSTNPGKKPYYYYMLIEPIIKLDPTVLSAPKPPAPAPLPVVSIPRMSMKSLFSNNAQVFYKPHSLSSGSGGVTNSRLKKRKT
jgi:hypothetical protein